MLISMVSIQPDCDGNGEEDESNQLSRTSEMIKTEEEGIGMHHAIKWLKSRGYCWGRLDLVFSDEVDSEVHSAKFSIFTTEKIIFKSPQH